MTKITRIEDMNCYECPYGHMYNENHQFEEIPCDEQDCLNMIEVVNAIRFYNEFGKTEDGEERNCSTCGHCATTEEDGAEIMICFKDGYPVKTDENNFCVAYSFIGAL